MSFLVRYRAIQDSEVIHDETVVSNVDPVVTIWKNVTVLGSPIELRIDFDPPLTAVVSEDDE